VLAGNTLTGLSACLVIPGQLFATRLQERRFSFVIPGRLFATHMQAHSPLTSSLAQLVRFERSSPSRSRRPKS